MESTLTIKDVTVEQIYTGCLSQAAYYIESEGEAAVIDPLRDPTPYLERAKLGGATIRYIFETHFHADFVSGHLDLQKATGADIVYGPSAKPAFSALIAKDGETFTLGKAIIKVVHTPGHTLESSCFLISDETGESKAIFTGDTLFLGDVGRPDLAVRGDLTKEQLAAMLFESVHGKLMSLSDDILIYPGHGAGSACGKNLSKETQDTLGHQKQVNYALKTKDHDEFIKQVLAGIPPPPHYFPENARMNREGYGSIDAVMKKGIVPLLPDAFEELANHVNALVLDTRSPQAFKSGFIPRSVNIGLDGSFASWVGALISDLTQPLLLVCDPGRESEAVTRLARVGYDNTLGYLSGGIDAWKLSGKEIDTLDSMEVNEFAKLHAEQGGISVLDVRNPREYESGHLSFAQNFPLDLFNENMGKLRRDQTYYVHCAGGYRSMVAASILKARGFTHITNIEGGYNALATTDIPRRKIHEDGRAEILK